MLIPTPAFPVVFLPISHFPILLSILPPMSSRSDSPRATTLVGLFCNCLPALRQSSSGQQSWGSASPLGRTPSLLPAQDVHMCVKGSNFSLILLPPQSLFSLSCKSSLSPLTSHPLHHPITKFCLLSISGVCLFRPKPIALVQTSLLLPWILIEVTHQVPPNSSFGAPKGCPSDHSK